MRWGGGWGGEDGGPLHMEARGGSGRWNKVGVLNQRRPGHMVDLVRKKEEKIVRRKNEDWLSHRRKHGGDYRHARVRLQP
jgi:hypothetical protein